MSRASFAFAVVIGASLFALGCSSHEGSPSAPTTGAALAVQSHTVSPGGAAHTASRTHGEPLSAVVGHGQGTVNVTPTAAVDGSFSAEITVNVHGAPANTIFYVQRAPEVGRASGADGTCQRAAGAPPWGPPAANFLTFPLPAPGALITLQTSAAGAGALHIPFSAPTIPDGAQFDVMFRLVDSLSNPANDLRTGCFTVTVK